MKRQIDLTSGSIIKDLILFMLPIFFANLFQQLYNTVDTMIVGYNLGNDALAAMGASASIYELMVGFATGVGAGFGVVIARLYGAKNIEGLKKAIASSLVLSLILSLIIMLLSLFLLKPLLIFLNTPYEIFDDAHKYIFIISIFVLVTVAYNLSAGLLRAKGNSFIPLISLIISSIINILLDLYFIVELKMGVEGAAIATVIAQFISAIFCIIYIFIKDKELICEKRHFKYDKVLVNDLIGQGLSMGMMLSIVALGTLILQTAINNLGTIVIASYISSRKIFNIIALPMSTLATALVTFVSQNAGANLNERIIKGVRTSNILTIIWGIFSIIMIYLFSDQLITLVSGNGGRELIAYSDMYLKIAVIFFPVLGVLFNLRSSLQGLGKKVVPLISSIVELVGKILFTLIFIPVLDYLGICLAEPIIWCMMTLQLIFAYRKSQVFNKIN